jgi:Putative zinc-finger
MSGQGRCTPELREAVGAFALGALEPQEADEVSAHLSACVECRAQYGEFLELVPLLAAVSEQEAVTGPVRPEPAVLGRVLAAAGPARATRRRLRPTGTRSRMALAACAALVAVGGVAGGIAAAGSGRQPVAGSWTASAAGKLPYTGRSPWPVAATVKVTAADSGSYIELTMNNIPKGYSCSLVVVTTDGRQEKGDSWSAPSSGDFTIPDTVPTPPHQIAAVRVVLSDGETLMTLDR